MVAKKKTASKEKKEEPKIESRVMVEEITEKELSGTPKQDGDSQVENPLSEAPAEGPPPEKSDKKLMRAAIMVVLVIFGVSGWVFYFANRYSQKTTQEEIAFEETATATPTATPDPDQLEREEITLEILNGSGVSGAAGDMAEIFENLGYVDVETGNAEDTVGNELYVNPEYEDMIDVLLQDVEDELDISSISGDLDEDSDYMARIVLGSEE